MQTVENHLSNIRALRTQRIKEAMKISIRELIHNGITPI